METKFCKICHEEKDIEMFEKSVKVTGGRRNQCKSCRNKQRDPEKRKEYLRDKRKKK